METINILIQQNGINYILVGDSYVPDSPLMYDQTYIGYYGKKRLDYLKHNEPRLYRKMQEEESLVNHLTCVNSEVLSQKKKLVQESVSFGENGIISLDQFRSVRETLLRIELWILSTYIYA